jgi:hypothetical protein
MFSNRTRLSLVQLLRELFAIDVEVLLQKNGIDFVADTNSYNFVTALKASLLDVSDEQLRELAGEIVRTRNAIRYKFNTKYVFDEHWRDLERSLQLDGFRVDLAALPEEPALIAADPTVVDQPVVEDDLTDTLRQTELPGSEKVIASIRSSAEQFMSQPPDYTASLTHSRNALHDLAKAIARAWQEHSSSSYDEDKWGQVIAFLRKGKFISEQEEKGVAGAYSFISAGVHDSLTESETARLGRTLAHSMAYFLTKRWLDKSG